MSELVEFYRARLDEEEQRVLTASPGPWTIRQLGRHDQAVVVQDTGQRSPKGLPVGGALLADLGSARAVKDALHIARHDPARVLRDVEAGREILAAYDDADQQIHAHHQRGEPAPATLQHERMAWLMAIGYLAAVHSDHPDYQEKFRV